MSQSKLSRLCRISQPIISNIVNCKDFKLSQPKCEEFGRWFVKYQSGDSIADCMAAAADQPCESETGKSEARLTFHPKQEVPQLRDWFEQNRNPSERMLSCYADILNRSSLRAERNKITVKSLKNWWKNYKQKQRSSSSSRAKHRTRKSH